MFCQFDFIRFRKLFSAAYVIADHMIKVLCDCSCDKQIEESNNSMKLKNISTCWNL